MNMNIYIYTYLCHESTWDLFIARWSTRISKRTLACAKTIKKVVWIPATLRRVNHGQPPRLRGFRPGFLHLSDSLLHVEVLAEIGIPQPRSDPGVTSNSWRAPSSSAHRQKKRHKGWHKSAIKEQPHSKLPKMCKSPTKLWFLEDIYKGAGITQARSWSILYPGPQYLPFMGSVSRRTRVLINMKMLLFDLIDLQHVPDLLAGYGSTMRYQQTHMAGYVFTHRFEGSQNLPYEVVLVCRAWTSLLFLNLLFCFWRIASIGWREIWSPYRKHEKQWSPIEISFQPMKNAVHINHYSAKNRAATSTAVICASRANHHQDRNPFRQWRDTLW